MTDHTPAPSTLSPAGRDRKAQMLTQLQSALSRRAARRRHLRTAGSMSACTLAVAVAWAGVVLSRAPVTVPHSSDVGVAPGVPEAPGARTLQHVQLVSFPASKAAAVIVQTDPTRVERLVAAQTPGPAAEFLSDDRLLDELSRTGNSYGLVRSGVHVSVTCYSCPVPAPTDPPARRPD